MSMFCYQCQEAAGGKGCTSIGVCGKNVFVANYQDLLIHTLKGIAAYNLRARDLNINKESTDRFVMESLFATITNANFDKDYFSERISAAIRLREQIKKEVMGAGGKVDDITHDSAIFRAIEPDFDKKGIEVGVLSTEDEDIRSLRELLIYGLKGMAAYLEHADNLGYRNAEISKFMERALVATTDDDLSGDDLVAMNMECGKYGVEVMALLDEANTSSYGHPEITKVNIGVGTRPGILVSGHDLKDFEELLIQTEGTGVDVYTHGEMLPANYYPAFKKYDHFVGNYGNAWWEQGKEFEAFNGPIFMTTNCLVPPKESYKSRVFTTGAVSFEGTHHIGDREEGGQKDYSAMIELAKTCKPPTELETGEIVGGFAHNQVMALADSIIEAVSTGAIRRFFVMAGCDGRMKSRSYYTEFAEKLPKDTVILTAGCAKYRYNKLDLGDIGGIPRVLDAGQCNDSYSLAVIAMKLKEVLGMGDINELPISYNIAWYEQKAVIVLLALLYLGVKNIHLGPTLPAFLSPNVVSVLVENFGVAGIGEVDEDIEMFMA